MILMGAAALQPQIHTRGHHKAQKGAPGLQRQGQASLETCRPLLCPGLMVMSRLAYSGELPAGRASSCGLFSSSCTSIRSIRAAARRQVLLLCKHLDKEQDRQLGPHARSRHIQPCVRLCMGSSTTEMHALCCSIYAVKLSKLSSLPCPPVHLNCNFHPILMRPHICSYQDVHSTPHCGCSPVLARPSRQGEQGAESAQGPELTGTSVHRQRARIPAPAAAAQRPAPAVTPYKSASSLQKA